MSMCVLELEPSKTIVRQMRIDRSETLEGDRLCITWPVDARKLRTSDTSIVSPSFEVSNTACKLMIKAVSAGVAKRGEAGFKGAKGRGIIQLKSEAGAADDVPPIKFHLGVGSSEHFFVMRGPVTHNFANGSVCGLPSDEEAWLLDTAVDKSTQTFFVRLEVGLQL